jgi:hypothetical protein
MITVWRPGLALIAVAMLLGCADDGSGRPGDVTEVQVTGPQPEPTDASPPTTVESTTVPSAATTVLEPGLRDELLAMVAEDQAEMTGQVTTNNYTVRTERLAEILDEYGWPSFDLVGEDGSTAAWVIAQHADLDLDLQQRALELLRAAAAEGQASRGDLAYLEDRVAVATGQPQQYGTQIRCGDDNAPVPATPIADAESVDERRAGAGLPPLEEYIAEMTEVCAADG